MRGSQMNVEIKKYFQTRIYASAALPQDTENRNDNET